MLRNQLHWWKFAFSEYLYEGRFINKLLNGVILLVFKIIKKSEIYVL